MLEHGRGRDFRRITPWDRARMVLSFQTRRDFAYNCRGDFRDADGRPVIGKLSHPAKAWGRRNGAVFAHGQFRDWAGRFAIKVLHPRSLRRIHRRPPDS